MNIYEYSGIFLMKPPIMQQIRGIWSGVEITTFIVRFTWNNGLPRHGGLSKEVPLYIYIYLVGCV